jgi:hypothetical protein
MLPTPMTALVNWSLGAVYPCPPRTERGTTVNAAVAVSAPLIKSLRVIVFLLFISLSFYTECIIQTLFSMLSQILGH